MNLFVIIYKTLRFLFRFIEKRIDHLRTIVRFWGNGVRYNTFDTTGVPFVSIAQKANCTIGKDFSMHNRVYGNPIGCSQPCILFVDTDSSLVIGDNVGISQTALIAHANLSIGNNVKIGGGTYIYTSDFHSLSPQLRQSSTTDKKERKSSPVKICDNVFIGAHCIILKGVTIGNNSVIGAGSIVTKDVPANQIWAGNPAHFIRNL